MKRPLQRRTYIKEWRKHRGLTLVQLAERTGMTDAGLSMLENGRRGYTQESLETIAAALQTEPAALLTLDPGRPEAVWSWLAKFGQMTIPKKI